MSTWKILTDKNHIWKAHVASADLIPFLQHELTERWERDLKNGTVTRGEWAANAPEVPEFFVRDISECSMDSGGMCSTTRKWRDVSIDGLPFSVPSQDWTSILYRLRLEAPRKFDSGVEYYKIHDRFYCLVLTPAQRDHLINAMEEQLEEAEVEADEEDAKLAEAINKLNKSLGRTAVMSDKVEAFNAAAAGKKGSN